MTNHKIKPFGLCPKCKKNWKYQRKGEKYSRLIGIEDPKVYDGVSWWMCPFCKSKWGRWSGELVK
jgi:predicted Zn-ribbon and HTH transcriptional regulator